MPNPQTVALLISTFNWPDALEIGLLAVLTQTRMPDEVVIADDGSDERTKKLISDYKAKFKIPLKHVWHEDDGFRKSLILNKAVKQIESEYIIQIDGDIIVHPKFVQDHLNSAKPNYFVQGSRVMIAKDKSKTIIQTKRFKLTFFTQGLYNRFNAIRFPLLALIFKLNQSNSYHIKACNLAFWRRDYIAINGYSNGFEGWGGEDYDFGARLIHSGIKKRILKMLALSFHLFHSINSRANTEPNDKIYRKTLADKSTYTKDGFQQA